MAKRHIRYEDLPEYGEYKPGGTLGTHNCLVLSGQGPAKLIYGSKQGEVVLFPGDTLGYDCGSIWKVPAPSSYGDPIRRILAEAKISQRVLVYSGEPVRYRETWQDRHYQNSCADHSTGESATVLGPFQEEIIGYGHNERIYLIHGGKCVIVREVIDFSTTKRRRTKITQIVVRPNTDKDEVAEWLRGRFGLED